MRSRGSIACIAVLTAVLFAAAPAAGSPLPAGGSWSSDSCRLIGVAAVSPIGASKCPGIRPGAAVRTDKGRCTLNFVFRGSDGSTYVGTAGHCVLGDGVLLEDVGERTWARGAGPVARDGAGNRIGEFAYAVLLAPKDFSLIRLDPTVVANPQMCHFGGPTGINSDRRGATLLQHYGQGVLTGRTLPARTGLTFGTHDPHRTFALALATPGDSGGPVTTTDGRAYGLLFALGAAIGNETGNAGITRIGPQIVRAQEMLGVGMALVTAPKA
jgi:hypothetical protein